MLLKIDGWIIGKFEAFSHWTQRWFGIASPSWERFFLVLCILQFAVIEVPNDLHRAAPGFILFGDGFLMANLLGRFVASLLRTPTPTRLGSSAVRNPNKIESSECICRLMIVPLAIMYLPFALKSLTMGANAHLWAQCFAAAYIFAACDDLPVGPSKFREWLKSWRVQPAPQPVKVRA